jgi:hypothetical protein
MAENDRGISNPALKRPVVWRPKLMQSNTKEIVNLLKSEIEYLKKLKSAIGDIHGHIHSLAVKVAKIYLAGKHSKSVNWQISEKYEDGIDIVGKSQYGQIIVAAEVKTTARSEKETLGSQQRSKIRNDIEKLLEIDAKHKYLFIIDDKNRRAIESILKHADRKAVISLINIFEH